MLTLKYEICKTGITWFIAEKDGEIIEKSLTYFGLIKKLKNICQ